MREIGFTLQNKKKKISFKRFTYSLFSFCLWEVILSDVIVYSWNRICVVHATITSWFILELIDFHWYSKVLCQQMKKNVCNWVRNLIFMLLTMNDFLSFYFSGFKLIEFWFDMSPLGIWYITLLGFFHISKMLIQFQLWKWNCENVFFDNFSNFVAVICLWNLWEFFHVKVCLS